LSALPRLGLERDRLVHRRVLARRLRRPSREAVVEHQHLGRERQPSRSAPDRVQAAPSSSRCEVFTTQ